MNEIQKKIKRDIDLILKDQKVIEFSNHLKQWQKNQEKDYKKTLKSMKAHFEKEGYIFPRNWHELFWDWVWSSPPESEVRKMMGTPIRDLKTLELKPIPRDYFLQWAKEETQRLTVNEEGKKPTKVEKSEPLAVRFNLLKLLGFESETGFSKLPQKEQISFLRFILGCNERTAKGIKNGEEKYITPQHEARAKQLFDKIKKGDLL